MTAPDRPRRRLALSVRAALALVLLVGLLLGWIQAARRQHSAVLAIQARDEYTITYDDGSTLSYQGGFFSSGPQLSRPAAARWPVGWLEAHVGRDYFRTVVGVSLGGDSFYAPPLARADVVPTLLQLRHLRTVELPNLGLTDAEPGLLAGLASLESLILSDSGSDLSDAGFRDLGRLATLKRLLVWGDFTDDDLVALRGLDRLEELTLLTPSRRFDGGRSPRLTGRGLAHLAALPNLHSLEVESGRLDAAGLEALGQFRQLRNLKIVGGTYGDADLKPLARLTRLLHLSLEDAPIDGTGFAALGELDLLERVEVRSPRLSDAILPTLVGLPNLRSVTLRRNGLTIEAVEGLRAAPRLTRLDLPGLSKADQDRLRRALPNCQVFGVFD